MNIQLKAFRGLNSQLILYLFMLKSLRSLSSVPDIFNTLDGIDLSKSINAHVYYMQISRYDLG